MIYLLAKYSLLFLLAAALGFWLGYWFSRRNMVDVSESYEDLRTANARSDASSWDRLWQRLDALPEPKDPDYTGLFARLDGIDAAISGLPKPEPVSFAALEQRLDGVDKTIKAIPTPVQPLPVDLKPVNHRLDTLERAIREIPSPVPQRDVDLTPVQSALSSIQNEIKGIPVVETHAAADIDLRPVEQRLTAIEMKLGELQVQPAAVTPTIEIRSAEPEHDEPVILSAALYGEKDDLKRISGVGPKLERLLNANGVYYFWQVASWTHRDIDLIDERLDVFRGRISRDDWVSQAQTLKQQPGAATMPSER